MSERNPSWADVTKHCEAEIHALQASLEVIQSEATTNQLRGEIRALRRVLKLGEPMAPERPERRIQPDDTDSFV